MRKSCPSGCWRAFSSFTYTVAQSSQSCVVQGLSQDFDEAEAALSQADADLRNYLQQMQKRIGRTVQYVQLHKETHVLEVPEVRPLTPPGQQTSVTRVVTSPFP